MTKPRAKWSPRSPTSVGDASGSTETRRGVTFAGGWAGAAWLEPVLESVPESALLGGVDASLAQDDDPTDQAIASCHLAVDAATLAGRLASIRCESGAVGYTRTGTFDVRIGLRPHGDDSPVPGTGASVWEYRMTSITVHPTDEAGASWDPTGGAPEPVLSVSLIDDGRGTEVRAPVLTRIGTDVLDGTFDPPVVIARLPDYVGGLGTREIQGYWSMFDDDDGTLVPMDDCGASGLSSSGPAPSAPSDVGETFCLFNTIDDAVWSVRYDTVRFGNGWL